MQQGVIDKAPFQKSKTYTSQMGELYVDILSELDFTDARVEIRGGGLKGDYVSTSRCSFSVALFIVAWWNLCYRTHLSWLLRWNRW